jgi:hypothetical protein
MPNYFIPLYVSAPFRFGKYLIMAFFLYASFLYASFLYASFLYASFRFCPFPFMPLSGLMEIVDYAGFLYANFRRPLIVCELQEVFELRSLPGPAN